MLCSYAHGELGLFDDLLGVMGLGGPLIIAEHGLAARARRRELRFAVGRYAVILLYYHVVEAGWTWPVLDLGEDLVDGAEPV